MPFKKIKQLLQTNIGLHSETIGDSSIERAISHRMEALNISRANAYLSKLMNDQDELGELVEEVVVPETWFFRNLAPFEAMVECIRDMQKTREGDVAPLRILSAPCSTGEEPYSIAITLLKSGMQEAGFQIDAVDISKRALTKARRGIYGKHSFRESNGVADDEFFHKTRSGQKILPIVRDRVEFIRGNILKDNISPTPEYYDVIFCRNLLIYFDRETQNQVINKLHMMLKPDGVLFVGHAETSEVGKSLFSKRDAPKSFSYHKISYKQGEVVSDSSQQSTDKLRLIYDQLVEVTLKDIELSKKRKKSFKSKSKAGEEKKSAEAIVGWWKVDKLIEQGHLKEASSLSEKWLKEHPEEAQGYYYLGLISSLEGSAGAADSLLKKAIYLDPNHHKALGLSALLAEQRGDGGVAESLRRREGRARKRSQ